MSPWIHEAVIMLAPTLAIVTGAIFAQVKRKQYFDNLHITMNSRLDELLKSTRLQYFAEGILEGRKEVREEVYSKKTKNKNSV